MKIIFFSMPGYGHVNPTLVVAAELVRLGHTVIYYSGEDFRKKIEAAGVIFRSYGPHYTFDPRVSKYLGDFINEIASFAENGVPHLLSQIEKDKPDCIAYDSFAVWGKIVAHVYNVPAVSLFTTLILSKRIAMRYPQAFLPILFILAQTRKKALHGINIYKKLFTKYNMPQQSIDKMPLQTDKLNIVFTSSYFHPFGDTFDKSFRFVGPSLPPKQEKIDFIKSTEKRKIIYISMGTIFNDNIALFRTFLQTFKKTPYLVVLALGNRFKTTDLPDIPDNIIVRNMLPQLAVLEKASVFITHGGMNSVNESLFCGVPMVLIPQMIEQKINALRVAQLGAGIRLKTQDATPEKLLEAIETIIHTKKYYANATKIQRSLHNAGGYKKAAQEIIKYSRATSN